MFNRIIIVDGITYNVRWTWSAN